MLPATALTVLLFCLAASYCIECVINTSGKVTNSCCFLHEAHDGQDVVQGQTLPALTQSLGEKQYCNVCNRKVQKEHPGSFFDHVEQPVEGQHVRATTPPREPEAVLDEGS